MQIIMLYPNITTSITYARFHIPRIIMAVIFLPAASVVKTFYKCPTPVLQLISLPCDTLILESDAALLSKSLFKAVYNIYCRPIDKLLYHLWRLVS